MDSVGGLKVHIDSVHKLPYEKIENAIPGRDSVEGAPEIFLMEGVPEEIVADFYGQIKEDYYKELHEYQKKTGNPAPGSVQAGNAAKKIKTEREETQEERKARLAAHIAKKRRERDERKAKEAAEANGGIKQEAAEANDGIKQEPNDANDVEINPDQSHIKPEPTSEVSDAFRSPIINPYLQVSQQFNNNYYPGYAGSPPMAGPSMGQLPSQQIYGPGYGPGIGPGYGPGAGPQYGYSPTTYGQPPPFQHSYPNPNFPQQQPIGYGGSPYGFPPQSMANASPPHQATPITNGGPGAGMNGKNTMPAAAPGLPQRPSFDTPSYSKEVMAKFHHGQPAPQSHQAAGPSQDATQSQAARSSEDADILDSVTQDVSDDHAKFKAQFAADIDDLINQERHNAEERNNAQVANEAADAAAAAAPGPSAAPAPADVDSTRKVLTFFKWSDNELSPEEKKANAPKYVGSKRSHAKSLVCEQADSQAVAGNVADDLEQ